MKTKHQKTLKLIFSRPTPAGVKWHDVIALFDELGAEITEREGSRVAIFLFNQVKVMHRPHPSPDTRAQWLLFEGAGRKRSKAMKNVMKIGGQQAVIAYDPDIDMLRGEFVGLNGSVDFYACDIAGLHREGELSLDIFMDECTKRGIEPHKHFSGKFVLRIAPEVHQAATVAAAASGESLNQWVASAIQEAAHV